MENNPKDHHYVPQCYLNEFAIEKRLFCLDTELFRKGLNYQVRKTTPKQACKLQDLYLMKEQDQMFLEDKSIKDPLFLETTAFKKNEDKYSKIKANILKDQTILIADAIVSLNFIIDLKIRNPHFLNLVPRTIDNFMPAFLEEAISDLQIDPEIINEEHHQQLKDFIKNQVITNTIDSADFARQMGISFLINRFSEELYVRDTLLSELLRLKWFVYTILSEEEFITNDNPGFSINSKLTFYNTLFKGDFQFHLPIDSKNCLVINGLLEDEDFKTHDFAKLIEFRRADASFVNQVNVGHIITPNQFLYAKSKASLEGFLPKLEGYQNLNKG